MVDSVPWVELRVATGGDVSVEVAFRRDSVVLPCFEVALSLMSTVASVDPVVVDETVVSFIAVSYTHLTLPTTPYV